MGHIFTSDIIEEIEKRLKILGNARGAGPLIGRGREGSNGRISTLGRPRTKGLYQQRQTWIIRKLSVLRVWLLWGTGGSGVSPSPQ